VRGCGETPYLKLLTQLFGDRLLVANATGCSSIYGGNLPTTPYTTNATGAARLVELALRGQRGVRVRLPHGARRPRGGARERCCCAWREKWGTGWRCRCSMPISPAKPASPSSGSGWPPCGRRFAGLPSAEARRLETLADYLVKKSVWLVGGDGWAYDIGYGGLDHVLANRLDVNVLVLDTEVYSNTGGQQSKSTPIGAAAKFAASGKPVGKKDLGLLANMYGHVYVAKVAFGAKMAQTAQAFLEAEAYQGPSLIIAYSHCIAHGYDMADGAAQQKLAVDSGVWPLYRFDPRRLVKGEPPLHLDYGPPKARVADYMRNESRFRMVERADPERYKKFVADSQAAAERRYAVYQQLAGITVPVIAAALDESSPVSPEEK
jgi:pyruvate-ferredoxin/flavodoxin oxidoreductase